MTRRGVRRGVAAGALVLVACGLGPAAGATSTPSPSQSSASVPATRLCLPSDRRLAEQSGGLVDARDPRLLWVASDSGAEPEVYGLSTRTCAVTTVLRMAGVDARDIEAVTGGPAPGGRQVLWVCDTGDNRRVRTSVVLRLLDQPRRSGRVSQRPVSLRVAYADGPQDVEAAVWTRNQRLLLITKEVLGAQVLEVPRAAVARALAGHDVSTPVVAQRIGRLPQSIVTDAAALPDGRLLVRGYGDAALYAPPTYDGRLLTEVARLALPDQGQGETIAVADGGRSVLVASEGRGEPLWSLPLSSATGDAPSATTTDGAVPSPTRPLGVPTDRAAQGETGAQLVKGIANRDLATVLGALLLAAALPLLVTWWRRARGARR